MGNVLSCLCNTCDSLYEKYYPKCKYLQPKYVVPTLMVANLGYKLVYKPECGCNQRVANFVFSASTGATLGLQLWVFFVNGLTMMRVLPRHQFGEVQAKLFPKFFYMTTFFNFAALKVFLTKNPLPWLGTKHCLGTALATSFALNVINLTCFNPNSIKYNQQMHAIEKKAGNQTGNPSDASAVNYENDPEYVEVKKKFSRFHGYTALAGFLSFGCTVAEYYFLSEKCAF